MIAERYLDGFSELIQLESLTPHLGDFDTQKTTSLFQITESYGGL